MFSQILLVGYVARKPDLRFTPSGTQVCNWSMATNRSYKKGDEWQDETTWWRVTEWGAHAEVSANHLDKGSLVLVVGRLKPDSEGNPPMYQNKAGIHKATFEVTAERVKFLQRGDSATVEEFESEEVPF